MSPPESVPPPPTSTNHPGASSADTAAERTSQRAARVREPEPHLHRTLRHVVQSVRRRHPRSEADDLYQDAVVVACQHAHRYDPRRGATFATFVKRRAHGELLDQQRRETRRTKVTRQYKEERDTLEPTLAPSPEDQLEHAEEIANLGQRVAAALAELSGVERKLVCHVVVGGRSVAQVARELGMVEHKARYRYELAIARLRKRLGAAG